MSDTVLREQAASLPNTDVQGVSELAVEKLAKKFWSLRVQPDNLPMWSELDDEERSLKLDNASKFLAELLPAPTGVSEGVREKLEALRDDFAIAAGAEAEKCESQKEPSAEVASDAYDDARRQVDRLLASLPASQETVSEYRVVGENREGPWEESPTRDLGVAERAAVRLSRPGPRPNKNVRIERRTVTYSPWETVDE